MLLIGWALLTPAGQQPQWWLLLVAIPAVVGFVGSWHGQHLSSSVRRWAPMTRRNRRRRRHPGSQAPPRPRNGHRAAAKRIDTCQARVVIHLRTHPHALTTASSNTDQMPWEFISAWLDRYGVRADTLTVCSVTTTPPASSLRSGDAAPLLTAHTPQHRDTWLTYTLRAESNVAELTARRTTMASADTESESADPGPRRAALADTTARRMIAELRERGWLATLCDDATQLPRFVSPGAQLRRECWTGIEYCDGFRAVYAIEPQALNAVLSALPALDTRATWVTVNVHSRGRQPATIEASAATLTAVRPPRQPLPGLAGFHGLHRQAGEGLGVTGLDGADLPSAALSTVDLVGLSWPTAAYGVPIGSNRAREPVYLGLASPEPVRITVTGTPEFHMGITARIALSGLPVAVYTADLPRWKVLANYAAPQQVLLAPPSPVAGAIIVSDGSAEAPTGAISVVLRRPQAAAAPATAIVITQDPRRPDLFEVTNAHASQQLSTRW